MPFDAFAWGHVHFAMVRAIGAARREHALRFMAARIAAADVLGQVRDEGDVLRDAPEDTLRQLEDWCRAVAGSWICGFAGELLHRGSEADLVAELDRLQTIEQVKEALASLSDELRPLAEQRWMLGRSYEEIGRGLGLSLASVGRRLAEAAKVLSARLEKHSPLRVSQPQS